MNTDDGLLILCCLPLAIELFFDALEYAFKKGRKSGQTIFIIY